MILFLTYPVNEHTLLKSLSDEMTALTNASVGALYETLKWRQQAKPCVLPPKKLK